MIDPQQLADDIREAALRVTDGYRPVAEFDARGIARELLYGDRMTALTEPNPELDAAARERDAAVAALEDIRTWVRYGKESGYDIDGLEDILYRAPQPKETPAGS